MTGVIVIGSGVSGLSSALQSQQAGFKVRIIPRGNPQNTTSIGNGCPRPASGGGARLEVETLNKNCTVISIMAMPASAIPCHGAVRGMRCDWRKPGFVIS